MKKLALFFLSFTLITACDNDKDNTQAAVKEKFEKAQGNRYYGGTFNISENEKFSTLYPPAMIDAISYRIASQIYEGLVKFDQNNLTIIPAIAERWELDSTNTQYTFYLRKDVKFHPDPIFKDDKSRLVTAQDFVAIFKNLATKSEDNRGYQYVMKDKIKGANQYYNDGSQPNMPLEGVKAIDDYTLQITLEQPYSGFLYLLAMPFTFVFPAEVQAEYKNENMHIGTGPFKIKEINKDEAVLLERYEEYYLKDEHGNQLPFMDYVKISFIGDKNEEVEAFKKGKLDMVYRLPTEYIIEILEKEFTEGKEKKPEYITQKTPEMSTQYYEFLTVDSIFKNKKVRQAFNYAIDRNLIVNKILQGEAYGPGHHGITPPVFENYDVETLNGYKYNLEKAKQLLARAGYPEGKGFPTLPLLVNKGGGLNLKVAEEIKQQLKNNLGINVELKIASLNEKIDLTKNAKVSFWRSAWIADYPSPENFLSLFYGKGVPEDRAGQSYPNTARYKNPEFDRLYEQGLRATTIEEAYQYYKEAEKILIEDAPFIALWYDENYRILQPYVKNFPNNPMQYRDLSAVWIDYEIMQEMQDTTATEATKPAAAGIW